MKIQPAAMALWLALRNANGKVLGSNLTKVMWKFSSLTGSYLEMGMPLAQRGGWNHGAELPPLHRYVY